jgi:hypothetical protein
MGKQLEEMELKARDALINVYFGKSQDVFNQMRKFRGEKAETERRGMQAGLAAALAARATANQ